MTENKKGNLTEIAGLFLKLGAISFGGPAAHIAMMEDEVVKKRQWISQAHFLDLIGATNLIPGPNSTEMTMHCGHERAGWAGLIVAGLSFILPAVLITMGFAWLYSAYGQLPEVAPFIYGIKPAVIAIILSAVISLGQKALKNLELGVLGTITLVICLFGVNEIVALFSCGVVGILLYFIKSFRKTAPAISPLLLLQTAGEEFQISNFKILLSFLKVGALLYGSGYVLFAFLDAELVSKGLLTRKELIDAVAVGQFTPGPVLSTATFIGWQLGGFWGALAATIGIFLPSFLFVAMLNPLIPRLRKSPILSAFLDAVNVASVAVILAVMVEMSRDTLTDWRAILIAVISFVVVFYFKKLNSAFIVIGGAMLGYVLTFIPQV
ncbi:chromate efflux transporter [Adhaeribacter terreus]|uniref:Chromate efflux transporter n=1 Tax=Adhaeribacter terreus TaxID=529703 RepID=A0ABW0EDH9_9BACT